MPLAATLPDGGPTWYDLTRRARRGRGIAARTTFDFTPPRRARGGRGRAGTGVRGGSADPPCPVSVGRRVLHGLPEPAVKDALDGVKRPAGGGVGVVSPVSASAVRGGVVCVGKSMRQLEEAVLEVLVEAVGGGRAGIFSGKGDTGTGEPGGMAHSIACSTAPSSRSWATATGCGATPTWSPSTCAPTHPSHRRPRPPSVARRPIGQR